MVKLKSSTILLKGSALTKETSCSASVSPGYLLEFNGEQVKKQSTAKADCRRAFALENDLIGKTINDAYASGDNVLYCVCQNGAEVNAKLAASAVAVVYGDSLQAKGDGTITKFTDGAIVGYALESVDNSSGSTEVFVAMEVKA